MCVSGLLWHALANHLCSYIAIYEVMVALWEKSYPWCCEHMTVQNELLAAMGV